MILTIFLFWFVVILKDILFYLYLWQLKNYHLGRFLAHFQTENGKRILFDKLKILKILLVLLGIFVENDFFLVIFLIYFIEGFFFILNVLRKNIVKPIFTKKIILLLIYSFFSYLLMFLLTPLKNPSLFVAVLILSEAFSLILISLNVLGLEPFSKIGRKWIIKKATEKRKSFKNLKVIGITGSYGKSTTKEILFSILEKRFKTVKTLENKNSEMGISKAVLNDLEEDTEIFICEMGAYNIGGIKMLCDIVKPEIGILTGINSQHLATFGSQENIIKAKYELIESLPENGLSIFNGENNYCFDLFKKTNKSKKIFFLSQKEEADIWIEDIIEEKTNLKFKVFIKNGESMNFEIKTVGKEFIENLLPSILTAKELGMSLSEISQSLNNSDFSGIKVFKTKSGADILDSTYSSNPDGFKSHLNHLNKWEGKKAVIFRSMIELGSSARENHEEVGKKIGEICNLGISTTKEFFDEMKETIQSGMEKDNFIFSNNPLEIAERLRDFKEGDVILLENRINEKIIKIIKND